MPRTGLTIADIMYSDLGNTLGEPGPFLDALQGQLTAAFAHTFERLNAGTNPAVRKRADGRPRFLTPVQPVDEEALAP